MKPLKGVTVLDFSKVFAGPHCAQYLGDLGADVIKVEPVEGGDDTRLWAPQKNGQSSTFLAFNRNKRSLAVDLKTQEGRAIVHKLVKTADVTVQGFKGGTAKKLGLDYETLKGLNERLIFCEISGYGHEGPLAGQPGYDVMLQAFGGIISSMGTKDGPLVRVSFSPVDLGTGMMGVSAILAALMERDKTGKGTHIELTLLDTAMSLMAYLAQNYWLTGTKPIPMGSGHTSLAPYQAFSASDGDMMLGAGNDAQWRKLCEALGLDEYANDPRFATNPARVSNSAETVKLVQDVIATNTVAHWLDVLGTAGIPCAPVHGIDQALSHPQLEARKLVVKPDHPSLGPLPLVGFPVVFNGEDRETPMPPPLLGQHSADVLKSLGYDDEAITDLAGRGVVGLQQNETVDA